MYVKELENSKASFFRWSFSFWSFLVDRLRVTNHIPRYTKMEYFTAFPGVLKEVIRTLWRVYLKNNKRLRVCMSPSSAVRDGQCDTKYQVCYIYSSSYCMRHRTYSSRYVTKLGAICLNQLVLNLRTHIRCGQGSPFSEVVCLLNTK